MQIRFMNLSYFSSFPIIIVYMRNVSAWDLTLKNCDYRFSANISHSHQILEEVIFKSITNFHNDTVTWAEN